MLSCGLLTLLGKMMGNNSLCGCSESNLQERQRDEERLAATLHHLIANRDVLDGLGRD